MSPKLLSTVCLVTALASGYAAAEGSNSHGGDFCQNRIEEIRDDLRSWIQAGKQSTPQDPRGSATLDFTAAHTDLATYDELMLKYIRLTFNDGQGSIACTNDPSKVTVEGKEKMCVAGFEGAQPRILCYRGRTQGNGKYIDGFLGAPQDEQYFQIHHEFAVLAGLEDRDGAESNYPLSRQITEHLENQVVRRLAIKPIPSGFNAEFVKLGPASFWMGSPKGEWGRDDGQDDNAEPRHWVTLTHEFEIQTTPVTQAQWIAVMGTNPSFYNRREVCPESFTTIHGVAACPDYPVEEVKYYEALQFVARLNSLSGGHYFYRLPTEAEWEYAARGGTETAYFFGNDPNELFHYAWYSQNSGDQTHPVASLRPNPYGLYDMLGNVGEWTSDYYHPVSSAPATDPIGPSEGDAAIVRGGFDFKDASELRCAHRLWIDLNNPSRWTIGFRVVRNR